MSYGSNRKIETILSDIVIAIPQCMPKISDGMCVEYLMLQALCEFLIIIRSAPKNSTPTMHIYDIP